ncbi:MULTISPECIES: NAD-dependent epimerase/dehydratase family protein [Marinicauda]|jgi:dihydroflavonol-4-reductase|uniref:NAD-dependent epimerase/dehydratase family protein n=1 Tax=Marinicauda TaxID=1649466 RepID=UPI0022E603E6|nr:NAD-dependent epimerase/dehydratase family protein [Marinicauda sp. Alg238-R41]
MSDPVFDRSRPVLVTGATGYLAGWVVGRLLELGFDVHAAVRDPQDEAKRAHLDAMAAESPGSLKYFRANLLEPGSYDDAAAGCSIVFHTASPFTSKVSDPQRDLVDPAVKGTRTVLDSATRAGTVERVVLTSSCAAIYGYNADIQGMPDKRLTEDVWNHSSSLKDGAYAYSKTLAEKAAWEMAKAQNRWRLVTINPSFILGPGTRPDTRSESFSVVRQIGKGAMRFGAPPMEIGTVDVRDVAEAHIRAAFIAEAKGRHIVSAETKTLLQMGEDLRARFGDDYPFPKSEMPKWLVWIIGPMVNANLTRKTVSRNMNKPFRADNSKSKRKLGLEYRPTASSIQDMFAQMVEAGRV